MSVLTRVADKFVNIRGSFKIGPLDIGTHTSLVQRQSGKWLMLDSLKMEPSVKSQVLELTNDGADVEAIINLHPFHTVYCPWAHENFPSAKLYGSSRHHDKWPALPWQPELLDDPKVLAEFSDTLDLRIPAGVDFISSDENIHFSSVVAYHKDSRTIHVDDTFMFLPVPSIFSLLYVRQGLVQLHPTLAAALQPRRGAARDFQDWMAAVERDWGGAENLCAAHTGALLAGENTGDSIKSRLQWAVLYAKPVLELHNVRYGW